MVRKFTFTRISIDVANDREKWKRMIERRELGGVQLLADQDWNSAFVKEYLIQGIPRFIFIDPAGKIVDSNAPRPSDHQITTIEEQNIGISSPQHLDYSKSVSLYLHVPLQLTDWWKISVSGTTSLRNYQISYTPKVAAKTYLFQSFNFSQHFQLPGNFELEVSGWRNLGTYEGSNRTAGFGVVILGLAKQLKNDKGTFTLSLPDVFRSFRVHTYIGEVTDPIFDINSESDWWDETALYQVFRLSYSRNFGGQVTRKNRSREEELKRVEN